MTSSEYLVDDNHMPMILDGKIYIIPKEAFNMYERRYYKAMKRSLMKYVEGIGLKPIKVGV